MLDFITVADSLSPTMSAAKYDLKVARGEDLSFSLFIADSFDEPVSLSTGSTTFKAEIREDHKKPLVQAFSFKTLSGTGSADIDTSLATNELRFLLSNEQTITLDVSKKYKWDFFWTDSVGTVSQLLYGNVNVTPNITNL